MTSTKILLIDDSEIDQKVILGILGKQHTVVVAGTLEKARQRIVAGARNEYAILAVRRAVIAGTD